MVELTHQTIETDRLLHMASHEECGAVVLFLGTTRRWTQKKGEALPLETRFLEYETYESMAQKKLESLEDQARGRWPLRFVGIVHRLGRIEVGQASVAVVVGSPHRQAAFEAGQWLIDTLKTDVPIWKKEFWSNQSDAWIHPIDDPSNCFQESNSSMRDSALPESTLRDPQP